MSTLDTDSGDESIRTASSAEAEIEIDENMGKLQNVKIIELNNDNYGRWIISIQDALEGHKLWSIVDGKTSKPADSNSDATIHKTYLEWIANDATARSIIRSTLDEVTFNHVRDCATSKAVLDRIKELREPKTASSQMTAMTRFFTTTWQDTDDAQSFMANIAVIAGDITKAGFDMKDELIIAKTLSSLPSTYSSFVLSWNMMADATPTMTDFRSKLLNAERSIIGDKSIPDKRNVGEAMVAHGTKNHKAKGEKRFKGKCRYCDIVGHMERDCRKKKRDEANKSEKKPEGNSMMVSTAFLADENSNCIIADSGASRHLTRNIRWFKTLDRLETPEYFRIGNDTKIAATHVGSIEAEISVDGRTWRSILWTDVRYCADMTSTTLFSTTYLESKGFHFSSGNGRMVLTKDGRPFLGGVRDADSSYRPFIRVIPPTHTAMVAQTLDVWHKRLGHANDNVVQVMARNRLVDGLELVQSKRDACDACHFGKQPAIPHRTRPEARSCQPGERFHSDVCTVNVPSIGGNVLFVTLKDETSGYRMIRCLPSKDRVPTAIEKMMMDSERETKRKAISLRTDNGTEFCNEHISKFLADKGVAHERSAAYVKQQNGMAERENRTLLDAALSMLFNSDLTRNERNLMWAEAVSTAAYIRNRIPTRGRTDVTPFEQWFGTKPNISHLRVFGSDVFVKVPEAKRRKLDAKSRKTILVGYDWSTTKQVRVYDRDRRRVDVVGDYSIEEDRSTERHVEIPMRADDETSDSEDIVAGDDAPDIGPEEVITDGESSQMKRGPGRPSGSKNNPKPVAPSDRILRSKGDALQAMKVSMDPVSVNDALNRPDGDHWRTAMDDEYNSLMENDTWTLVSLPRNRRTVKNKWVFKSKTAPDGTLLRYKARLVACGYSQTEGIDYSETFSPVARSESIRCVLAIAAARNMDIVQFDVKTAFLNGTLNEEIYMDQPDGYNDGSERVCRLRKSIYGLKQSPRVWNEKFDDFVTSQGFVAVAGDSCVYLRSNDSSSDLIIMCLYVDDGLIVSTNQSSVDSFITKLKSTFDVTINDPNCYVGMEIHRDQSSKSITVNQRGYITRILERFGLSEANPVSSPLEPTLKLTGSSDCSEERFTGPYREAIGCLNYLSTISRPDITFAVNSLARFSNSPTKTHWSCVKRVIRYLKGTIDFGITFSGSDLSLVGYCDSDWGGELDERRSTSGYVFSLNDGPIAWGSRLQSFSELSSAGAEYVALSEGLIECLWLRPFLTSLGLAMVEPTTIFLDNKSAISMSKNPEFRKRTKHIAIRYHRIRQEQNAKNVLIEYVSTEMNPADMLTKPLAGPKLAATARLLNLE